MHFSAAEVQLFPLFSAGDSLERCRDRTFNAVVAGSIPARLTIVFNIFLKLQILSSTVV